MMIPEPGSNQGHLEKEGSLPDTAEADLMTEAEVEGDGTVGSLPDPVPDSLQGDAGIPADLVDDDEDLMTTAAALGEDEAGGEAPS